MIAEDYEIVSVEPTDTPTGLAGSGWHRYVIGRGDNEICGYRRGERSTVVKDVKEIVARMNERRSGKRGRVQLVTQSAAKKATARQA